MSTTYAPFGGLVKESFDIRSYVNVGQGMASLRVHLFSAREESKPGRGLDAKTRVATGLVVRGISLYQSICELVLATAGASGGSRVG